jgi:predicted nucleic acid-binding protein
VDRDVPSQHLDLTAHLRGVDHAHGGSGKPGAIPGLDLADSVIAATADVHGFSLATPNVRHFPMFMDVQPPFRVDY